MSKTKNRILFPTTAALSNTAWRADGIGSTFLLQPVELLLCAGSERHSLSLHRTLLNPVCPCIYVCACLACSTDRGESLLRSLARTHTQTMTGQVIHSLIGGGIIRWLEREHFQEQTVFRTKLCKGWRTTLTRHFGINLDARTCVRQRNIHSLQIFCARTFGDMKHWTKAKHSAAAKICTCHLNLDNGLTVKDT